MFFEFSCHPSLKSYENKLMKTCWKKVCWKFRMYILLASLVESWKWASWWKRNFALIYKAKTNKNKTWNKQTLWQCSFFVRSASDEQIFLPRQLPGEIWTLPGCGGPLTIQKETQPRITGTQISPDFFFLQKTKALYQRRGRAAMLRGVPSTKTTTMMTTTTRTTIGNS